MIATTGTSGPIYVVSTPISGWFHCAAERGPGIAIWISLLEMATTHRNVQWLPNAPKPTDVALWVHLGAGLAARDFQTGGRTLGPLPSPDAQRYSFGPREVLPVPGVGAHIYHHTPEDRLDKTSADFVKPVAAAFHAVIEARLKSGAATRTSVRSV